MSVVYYQFRQARILRDFNESGATLEDLARAWASVDGKRDAFDAEKDEPASKAIHGHYLGYLVETEEILQRAIQYAIERKGQ
jgi:hypothetical protein